MPTPTAPSASASKDVMAAVQKKLKTMDFKNLQKGSTVKLNSQAAWSVNYTT